MKIPFVWLMAVLVVMPAQEVGVLDLTVPIAPAAPSPREAHGSSGMIGSSDPRPRWTLSLSLVSLDHDTLAWGDRLIYEVILTNTGTAPLDLPWSADPSLSPQSIGGSTRVGSLGLVVVQGSRRILLQAANGIYGTAAAPASMKHLAPGESVRIRAPGYWRPMPADQALPTKADVRAQFSMDDGLISSHETVFSSNELTVQNRPPDQ